VGLPRPRARRWEYCRRGEHRWGGSRGGGMHAV